jgi:Leucine-rich repeat (LRR) protein
MNEAQKRIADCSGTILDFSNLGLTELPAKLFNSTKLRILYLEGNKLTQLPAEIGQLNCQILR